MTDLRQTKEYARYMEMLGWQVAQVYRVSRIVNRVYVRKIPLFGNVAKLQRPSFVPTTRELDIIAKKNKLVALYLEPLSTEHCLLLTKAGFAKARTCFLPAKTIQIDLTKSEKELLSEMKPKTRYNIRLAQKRGVVVKSSHDIESFVSLWHSSARRRGMFLGQKKEIESLWRAFGPNATLLFALKQNDSYANHVEGPTVILGGILMLRTGTTAYYMYAASTKTGNKLFAPTLVAWEAIKLAKSSKCKIFDFEGIYDERYPQTKKWKGFTRFKEGFGGKTVTYPGTFVKYYNPLAKLLRL